jgi:UDP-2,3-diacylglucosamine hydrolase
VQNASSELTTQHSQLPGAELKPADSLHDDDRQLLHAEADLDRWFTPSRILLLSQRPLPFDSMMNHCPSDAIRGIAVSDLHLFAHRSAGMEYFNTLRPQLASADLLVLNGDIFDFRWSTLPSLDVTADRAVEWLRSVRAAYPACEIHYVRGNHDCPAFFTDRLDQLANSMERFRWHEYGVRIGTALFVHGDCTHRKMNPAGLRRFREEWDNDRQHGGWRTKAYLAVDRLGVTRFAHQHWFPRKATGGTGDALSRITPVPNGGYIRATATSGTLTSHSPITSMGISISIILDRQSVGWASTP